MDDSAAATPVSQPPVATELQQSHSQVSITAADLCTFSDSLSAFQQCFNDLQRHIVSIQTSINSMLLPPQPLPVSSSSPQAAPPAPAPAPEPEPSWESDPSEDLEEEEEEEEVKQEEKEVEGEGEGEGEEVKSPLPELKSPRSELKSPRSELKSPHSELKPPRSELKSPHSELKPPRSELEIFCETMDHRGLRKYMMTHIVQFHRLREEATKALRLSPSPASLVFKCIGDFYVTVGKKYANQSHLNRGRKAEVLLLECFLLMDNGVEIEKWVKEEAELAAFIWLESMNSEGVKPQEIDARGLLYFIGGFGIPDKFTNANIRYLLEVSNLKWASYALKRSNVLMAKFPEIIEEMVANKAVIKAVDIVYSVGMQDKFNPRKLLTTFIRESKKTFDNMNGSQVAHQGNIGVKRKYLADLKAIIKCLRYHVMDPSKVLPGWEFTRRIMSLEREIAEFNKQIADKTTAQHKRKSDGTVWLSNKEVKRSHFSNPWPPQDQRVLSNVIKNNTLFEGGGSAGHNYGYLVPPLVLHGPVAGSMPNVGYSLAGPVGGMSIGGPGAGISPSANSIHAGIGGPGAGISPSANSIHAGIGGPGAGISPSANSIHAGIGRPGAGTSSSANSIHEGIGGPGAGISPSASSIHAGVDVVPQGVSYVAGHGGNRVDSMPGQIGSHAGPSYGSSYGPNTIAANTFRPAPLMESSKGLPNTIARNTYRPAPLMESSKGLPNTTPGDSNRMQPYLEVSPGLPNTIPNNAYRPAPYVERSKVLPNTIPDDANRPPPQR